MENLDNVFKIKLRIRDMMAKRDDISTTDITKMLMAIKKLSIFNHLNDPFIKESNKEIYDKNQDYYIKRMNWINEYMNSKSFEEIIFRKPEDFDISSEDYDYYCAPKTELQY